MPASVRFDIIRGFLAMTAVEILVLEGAMPSSVAITFDVLETANRLRRLSGLPAAFSLQVRGSGARSFRGLVRAARPDAGGDPELVIVPGLGFASDTAIAEGLARSDVRSARRRLVAAAATGAAIAASCSSVFLLAAAGLLDGRRATTTWWLAPIFREMFPDVQLDAGSIVVCDGPVTTAGAAMAQMDLMLALVARHAGPGLADRCARHLLLDERRSQTPYMAVGLLTAADEPVRRAQAWARDRLEAGLTVDDLAAAAGLAPRTFSRRIERVTGLSPVRFLQRLRVERAVELIETTRLPFEEIARQVGYAEPSTLRRLLRKDGGVGPRELRSRVQKVPRFAGAGRAVLERA